MDVGVVGFAVTTEWGRHADDDRVALSKAIEFGCGTIPATRHGSRDPLRSDVLDVRFTAANGGHLRGIDVKTRHREPGFGKYECEGQANIPLSNHTDGDFVRGDPFEPTVHSDLGS